MRSKWNDPFSRASLISVEEIRRALVEDSGWLTPDEILTAPIEDIEAELADQDLVPVGGDEEEMIRLAWPPSRDTDAQPPPVAGETLAFPVERPALVAALHQVVMTHSPVVLNAPAGSGKSHFVVREYLGDPRVRADFPRRIVVDCAALRMASRIVFGREAAWAHFGTDDRGFKAFLADYAQDEDGDALTALINARLDRGGVLIFDHAEYLDRSGEIDSWLIYKVLPCAQKLGVKVIFIERSPAAQTRPALHGLTTWPLPDIATADVAAWLATPALRDLPAASLSPAAVMMLTGGRPGLLRDLGLFIPSHPQLAGVRMLRRFRKWRLGEDQFFTDCERLVRAARRHPDVIERAVAPGGLGTVWSERELGPEAVRDLLGTGAIRRDAAGMLRFASPLYRHRLTRLVQPDALARFALHTNFRSLAGASGRALRWFGEVAADALAKSLGYEKSPVVGLQRLADFLSRWDLNVRIYLRDRDNARLWAPYDMPEGIGPLECWMQPDFARAAQTGQIVRADDGRVFIPVISNTGIAGMVIVIDFLKRASALPYRRQVDVDRIAGVLHGIRPTLAQLVQRLALHRERKFQGKIWFKSKSPDLPPGRHGLLREVGCQSIVVFEKRGARNWGVARFERTGDGEDGLRWTESFSASRLEAIARHPSKRGLVLSGDHALDVFPRLCGRNAAVYLHPIPRPDDAAIVAFLFEGSAVVLDGHVQAKLSGFAPDLLVSAA